VLDDTKKKLFFLKNAETQAQSAMRVRSLGSAANEAAELDAPQGARLLPDNAMLHCPLESSRATTAKRMSQAQTRRERGRYDRLTDQVCRMAKKSAVVRSVGNSRQNKNHHV